MKELLDKFKSILDSEKLLYMATSDGSNIDCSTVCYAFDDNLNLYFGSYSDTLKCRNIAARPVVAVAVSTLQFHGTVRVIEHGSEEYNAKIKIYNERFPQYKHIFDKIDNELYEIRPLVIWYYNPSKGEMHRDVHIFDHHYYKNLKPYTPPGEYGSR